MAPVAIFSTKTPEKSTKICLARRNIAMESIVANLSSSTHFGSDSSDAFQFKVTESIANETFRGKIVGERRVSVGCATTATNITSRKYVRV